MSGNQNKKINNQEKNEARRKLNERLALEAKQKRVYKAIIGISALLSFSLVLEYFIEYMANGESGDNLSFFAKHFVFGPALILIGVVALFLPMIARNKYNESKGDNLMIIVAMLLFLLGIGTFIVQFIM